MDFDMLGLAPRLITRLAELGITRPTPIQTQAIPHAMNGRDVMGLAQTGTGKTAAFGLPLIHTLSKAGQKPAPRHVHGLVLAPTRELVRQIYDNLRDFTKGSHLKVHMVVGGVSLNRQAQELGRGTDLLIATPGRLIDLLDREAVSLSRARFLVLDEADQMLDMGFIHALRRIAPLLPAERQTMLFSATMPKLMADLAKNYLNAPVRVEVSRPGVAVDRIRQSLHFVEKAGKPALLKKLLATHPSDKALVFARTKHGSEKLMKKLRQDGFDAGSIHGNKSQGQRDRAIAAFKAGEITVLVATDVAARGIDIENVGFVYNFDLPNVAENYVHRIGRTARAGADGASVAFCAPEEMSELAAIQKAMNKRIPVEGGVPWAAPSGTLPKGGKPAGRPGKSRRRRRPGRGAGHRKAA